MKHFALVCLGVALLAGCRKDDVIVCAVSPVSTIFSDLRAAAPPVQTFAFDLGQAQSLRTSGGATVAFGANAFLAPNGSLATGQATLRMREIYTVPDMLLANIPTMSNYGQMLISGGEFDIQVWQGSNRLRMASNVSGVAQRLTLMSPVPTAGLDTTRMLLWNMPFTTRGQAAGAGRDTLAWQLVGGTVPSTAGYYSAALPLDSISRWNIDQFWYAYQSRGTAIVETEVTTSSASTVTRVYFRPVGFNGLAIGYNSAATRWICNLPIGADMVAVVLQERGGQLYYGTERFTVRATSVLTPTLQALSSAEIIQRIRQL
ncbi:hypothetical protein I2I05_07180 [Hymenobacter sp. BT683]|uniref:Uncharacterized protein n=1 Tax=Hymenobacter jeongseonensis TaxID=2791027 RepID=A0ABS0IFS4_9BACT|nr:hypothetical protein [Hymenobacter jeongseonensis]MBF9237175.1 hypothetical protein [Hymenobacter jeongseonensis]